MRGEVIVRFVDIGGIVDHHCLIFLFIIRTSTLRNVECLHRSIYIQYIFSQNRKVMPYLTYPSLSETDNDYDNNIPVNNVHSFTRTCIIS
jgi:hypothetical protein